MLDFTCGNRTYDTTGGYNHAGIDYFTWPFTWKNMDAGQVEIVAAAAGQIVLKADGNNDRSCAFNSSPWNAVYVRHSDGATAWYGHMKNGSLTTKMVGDMVAVGEYLGLVGSSGNSTGPHLHFELRSATNQTVEPHAGACRSGATLWASQRAYRDSALNELHTHSAVPVFAQCPATT